MADNQKYLDLNGLSYAVRKMNNKKANLESPDFSGTPAINGEKIATENSVDLKIQKALIEGDLSNVLKSPEDDELLLYLDMEVNA